MKGEEPFRRGGIKSRISRSLSGLWGGYPSISQGPQSRLGEAEDEEGEESEETEVAASPEDSEAQNLDLSNEPLVSKPEPNFLKMMEQMTQLMGQITQNVHHRENSRASEFKTPSIKEADLFDGTKAHKLRGVIRFCQSIFHNDPEDVFYDRKKVLYSTSFVTGSAVKWI
ncbi:hypothetical protein O181_066993 [Austropuccinia psidii MF-1]|uniref:DUF4939 domain-containing protein n=1 Tax=Austropuccinia psidii MF-1 TaxID=1389203 RepID=A0A9Q3EY23_9BASI|nr:hypothetical protein [Austropuccinia psidii MF-1]